MLFVDEEEGEVMNELDTWLLQIPTLLVQPARNTGSCYQVVEVVERYEHCVDR
jgi:hypothetical protein